MMGGSDDVQRVETCDFEPPENRWTATIKSAAWRLRSRIVFGTVRRDPSNWLLISSARGATPDCGSDPCACTNPHAEASCSRVNGLHAGLKHYAARKRRESQNELTPVFRGAHILAIWRLGVASELPTIRPESDDSDQD